ncbi:Diflavin flavoprotein A 1 [Burkholderiales bacterium]|nr:MAG: MBL fold metallo-hydrolase [Burkholderiales bacterium]CAG0987240.1 Diflavin flavoprotein A 1 [Burkholderiales bacterium]
MAAIDFDGAVPITRDIFWVGKHASDLSLHCNPYLLVEDDEAVLIDPGSIPDFPVVMRKIIDLANPQSIALIVASHQDPDVCSNLAVVEDVVERPDLQIAAHGATHRLIRHYGLRSALYAVEEHGWRYTLQSGRVLEFFHTPHLHCAGSIMSFDRQTGTLFSSDLFGASDDDWALFSGKDHPGAMTGWHQAMMPANHLLRACMEKLEALPIQRICPQHGSVIEGANVALAIAHLKGLPVGLDLMAANP